MAAPQILDDTAPFHSPAPAAVFVIKRTLLQIKRTVCDQIGGVTTHPIVALDHAYNHGLSEQRSALWGDETIAERRLQLGKVQNLRLASRRINGMQLARGDIFSFWKQVGAATRQRGYAVGRELREGCLIPAIGGGLCQLSNALYSTALDSGAEIIERRAHSRVVPGSAAAHGRDATVAFNYVYLRFRFEFDVRIESILTRDELIVRVLCHADESKRPPAAPKKLLLPLLVPQATGSCVTCGEDACFRHARTRALKPRTEKTAYLLDKTTPEFVTYVRDASHEDAALFLPLDGNRYDVAHYDWSTQGFAELNAAPIVVAKNAFAARFYRSAPTAAARARHLRHMDDLATAYSRKLRPEHTHLVVSQDLLAKLRRNGSLGGRTFDVLMTRLPITLLQERLDAACKRWPESRTLGDFRARAGLAEAETDALAAAAHIITAHPEIARLYGSRAGLLPWIAPSSDVERSGLGRGSRTLVFPGPTVGRKGCHAVRDAARRLDLELLLLGNNLEHADFWRGVNVRTALPGEDWTGSAFAAVQPSLWEESPRRLLRALSAGMPVIATAGCGLGNRAGVATVAFGDSDAIVSALEAILASV